MSTAHVGSRIAASLALLVVGAAAPPRVSVAQGARLASNVRASAPRLLDRRARLQVHNVGLVDALRALEQRSGVPLAYSPSLLPAHAIVSCACGAATVREAVEVLLSGFAFTYREMEGQLLVVPVTQDARNRLFRQTKYANITAPIRIASELEARYIAAEAQLNINANAAPALTLIAERRTAGGQPAFAGTTTAAVLAELMDQRARDFWLEAKHLGDIIRSPSAAALVPATGSAFYKSELGTFLPIAFLPVPFAEKANNPNF